MPVRGGEREREREREGEEREKREGEREREEREKGEREKGRESFCHSHVFFLYVLLSPSISSFPPNMAALSAWFWNERFWLPHNVTWADLADPAPGVEYPKAGHLLSALPLALGIFAVRNRLREV